MNIRGILHHTVLSLALTIFIGSIAVSPAHAADAVKSAPVAQQKPAAQKRPVAQTKVQPRQNTSHLTTVEHSAPRAVRPDAPAQKKTAHANPKTPSGTALPQAAHDKIKSALDVFAKNCVTTMNKQRMPGIFQKEVKRQPDGTFMARYLAVDPDSLQTSYNPTNGHKTITHIGRMDYHEVEYVSVGSSQKQALAGPFNEVNRSPITELIKYKQGKWCY